MQTFIRELLNLSHSLRIKLLRKKNEYEFEKKNENENLKKF